MKINQKVLNWPLSFLVISGLLIWNPAFANTPSYKAGKYAFLMEACGFYLKSDRLFNTFAKGDPLRKEQFYDGYRDIDTVSESGDYGHNNSYDCDVFVKVSDRLLKTGLIVASNTYNSRTSRGTEAGDRTVCYMAYDAKLNTWDHSSNSARYVVEAKSRGFSPSSCASILGRSATLASNSASSSFANVNNREICYQALKTHEIRWDDNNAYFKLRVDEAKARGLSEQDCASILGRATTVASSGSKASKITNENDRTICKFALTGTGTIWETISYFQNYVNEAKSRGLSEEDCASILGRSVTVASNSYSSRISRGTEAGDRTVCYMAYDAKLNKWDHSSNSVRYVREAKSRGFSPRYCASILDGTSTVVSRPDPQPSYALIKRTQEALKSLGLYQGKIDGVVGVQSRSALKQWQKRSGFADTGKIEEAQIVKLESDALEAIAKREEERKEKAKRLAEANRIKNPDAIAVIIGNKDYKGSTPDVDFAANDADAMKDYVLNKLGYRPGNVIDLRDATQAELRDTFGTKESHKGRLFDYVRADESDVIVFYSGHGVPGLLDKRGYLLSVDSNPNRAEITGYPIDVLLKNLAKVPAKSMKVFIDACFSGDSPKGMLVRATSGLTVKITAPKKASDNMIVITAAEGDQFASWDEDAKHGLFTKYLLEALNGEADRHAKTGNKDGKVTLGEVKAYLDREMTYQARRRFSRDQNATVSGDLRTVLFAY